MHQLPGGGASNENTTEMCDNRPAFDDADHVTNEIENLFDAGGADTQRNLAKQATSLDRMSNGGANFGNLATPLKK